MLCPVRRSLFTAFHYGELRFEVADALMFPMAPGRILKSPSSRVQHHTAGPRSSGTRSRMSARRLRPRPQALLLSLNVLSPTLNPLPELAMGTPRHMA